VHAGLRDRHAAILLFKPGISAPFPIGILPYHGYIPFFENPLKWLHALVVPWIAAGLPLAAVCLRMTRATMTELREEDFIRTAAAKGLSPVRISVRPSCPSRCRRSSRWPAPIRRC
jgi:ABC-type dipeptide/oligopeptide/nickel transport system permease component